MIQDYHFNFSSCNGFNLPYAQCSISSLSASSGSAAPEDLAREMEGRASNLTFGIGRLLHRVATSVSSLWSKTSPNQPTSAWLTTRFGAGHASIRLYCRSCGESDRPFERIFSFYPNVLSKDSDGCMHAPSPSEDPLFALRSVIIGLPGTTVENTGYCYNDYDLPLSVQSHPITEEAARRVYTFAMQPHRYHFLGVSGYNCLDFTQEAYSEAGLPGHFSEYHPSRVAASIWGTLPPLHLALHRWIYPLHPASSGLVIGIAAAVRPFLRPLFRQ